MRNIIRWILLVQLITFLFISCAIKPNPIYKSKDRKKSGRTVTDPYVKRHSENGHPPELFDADGVGDEGVDDDDAPYTSAAAYDPQSLQASYEVWRLANELIPFLRTPYKYGGEDTTGVDCSGLVKVVFEKAFGLKLPHKAAYQYRMGKPVSRRRLEAGDLVFFYDKRYRRIGHVGIYLGDGQFIHSMIRKGVVISRLGEGYWKTYYAGARRLIHK